jgi:hypothetical protein
MISADDLVAGSGLTYAVAVPPELVGAPADARAAESARRSVRLRPLTVHDLQLISRAAKESDSLTATLMVQRALIEPEVSVPQVAAMPVGLVQFLLERVNEISGITTASEQIRDAMTMPITKAAFVLAREFGWTPAQVQELTLGQVLLHLEMLKETSP